jgi:hypothetical protein
MPKKTFQAITSTHIRPAPPPPPQTRHQPTVSGILKKHLRSNPVRAHGVILLPTTNGLCYYPGLSTAWMELPLDLQRKKAITFESHEIAETSTTKAMNQVQQKWDLDLSQPLHTALVAKALQKNAKQHASKTCRHIFNVTSGKPILYHAPNFSALMH